jgi:hypothetical protein
VSGPRITGVVDADAGNAAMTIPRAAFEADCRQARFSRPNGGKISAVVGKRGRPMDDQQAASQPAVTKPAPEGLRRNSLNLPRLAFIGLAYFSLAPVIYLNMALWRPIQAVP